MQDCPVDRAGSKPQEAAAEQEILTVRAYLKALLTSERKEDCAAFLTRAVTWYADQGRSIERVLTDNAKAYTTPIAGRRPAPVSESV